MRVRVSGSGFPDPDDPVQWSVRLFLSQSALFLEELGQDRATLVFEDSTDDDRAVVDSHYIFCNFDEICM